MEDTVDFTKICRSCLSDSGPFKDLFLVCTPEMYKYCTSVEVIYHVLIMKKFYDIYVMM